MRIAVTGSSGFVGSCLVDRLNARGHAVLRLVRELGHSTENCVLWSPQHGLQRPQMLEGVDAVIHLAGRSIAAGRWTNREKQRIRDSRVQATTVLAHQLLQLNRCPPVFLSTSAIGIYGDCGDRNVDEAQPPGSDFLASVAQDWESATEQLTASEIRVPIARLGIVLGRHGGALAKMLPLFRWCLGGKLGSGQQFWSWIALEDVVSALLWMLESPTARGPYNVVADDPVTNAQFTRLLAGVLHRPAVFPVPRVALRLAMGEMADALLLTSCRAVPRRLLQQGFQPRYNDLQDFLQDEFSGGTLRC